MPSQHWKAIRNDTTHRAMPDTKVVRMRNLTLGRTTIKIGNVTYQDKFIFKGGLLLAQYITK